MQTANSHLPDPNSPAPYRQAVPDLLSTLGVDPQNGLDGSEAESRLERFGPNELAVEKPIPGWRKFAAQFTDVLVILLIIAAIVSAVIWFIERGSALPYEAFAIFAIVILNGVMGYIQQARAEQAIGALRNMSAADATVIRDGTREQIPAAELVPGDLIVIEEGDTVPADARVIQSAALQTFESALTGESLPVPKETSPIAEEVVLGDRRNMVFSGTAVSYGHGMAVVTETGMRTQMGRIAGMLEEARDDITPLQRELNKVGRVLGGAVIIIAIIMIATILIFEHVTGVDAIFQVLIFGVALAVAAVPEGLPAIVTAVLSLGVQRMAAKKAIVRHLASVETLGSADIIASDKTGTLTKNEMTVRKVITASGSIELGGTGYIPEGEVRSANGEQIEGALKTEFIRTLAAADRANNAVLQEEGGRWTIQGDPTEAALIVAARKAGLEDEALDARFERVGEVPFSSDRKLMSTIHTDNNKKEILRAFTKGAPDVLLKHCTQELIGEEVRPLTDDRRKKILADNESLANEALRTLGVAFRSIPNNMSSGDEDNSTFDAELEQDLVFLGLIGMMDPPRDEVGEAVARAQGAGIRVMMITGDHPRTAAVIATELGIADSDGKVITGTDMERMSDEDLNEKVHEVSVYARVSADHKLRIVKALRHAGLIVAMTGDGVNDAPALKSADIGIAMGITGTDVSKEASDIVLADDNFATIVTAVEEGRAIFDNIRKFLRYLLSSNIGEVMTMFFGVLLANVIGLTAASEGSLVLPLLATQILWINLVTDGAPALALGVDPADLRIMQMPPRPPEEGVITASMWGGIFFVGLIMAVGTLFIMDASLPGGFIEGTGTIEYARTMGFTTLVMFQLFNAFNARSDEQSAFIHLFSNRWLWASLGLSLGLHVLVIYVPFLQQAFSTVELTLGDWLRCTAVASSGLVLREVSKMVGWRREERIVRGDSY